MGNSEVGHMNIGAGRIVYQDLTRIDAAIEDGSFFANAELRAACAAAKAERRHAAPARPAVARRRAQPRAAHLRDAATGAPRGRAAGRRARVPRRPRHAAALGASQPAHCLQAACANASAMRASPPSAAATTRWTATSAGSAMRRAWDAIVEADAEHVAADALAALARRLRARRERRVRARRP